MMYKVVNSIAPTIVSELSSFSNANYNLRKDTVSSTILKDSMEWTESISY